jgi:AraC-like DNA-binding protein
MSLSEEEALGRGSAASSRSVEFSENLRPHDNLVSPVLRYIVHHVDRGFESDLWYEEQFIYLLERLLRSQHNAIEAARKLPAVRRSTRHELLRRIGWGTDYIQSYYARELTVDDLARAAHLSKYHFVRLFAAVHRITPYAFVQRKRASVAQRLLETTKLPHHEIAARVGFENRSTMFRQLVRWTGHNARTLRRLAKARAAAANTTRG